jgi:hypothetical protein
MCVSSRDKDRILHCRNDGRNSGLVRLPCHKNSVTNSVPTVNDILSGINAKDSRLKLRVETLVPGSSSILEDLHLHRLTGRVSLVAYSLPLPKSNS